MEEKLAQASDYKICPLKCAWKSNWTFQAVGEELIRERVNEICNDDGDGEEKQRKAAPQLQEAVQFVKVVFAACDGPACAWWDAKRERCGVLPER